jgi:hypothetical protein
MKKILFAALLVAGTTLGFAKDDVKNEVETTITKKEAKQTVMTLQTDSSDEALRKATCTNIHAFFSEVTLIDEYGNASTQYEYLGSIEVHYECDQSVTDLYVWID